MSHVSANQHSDVEEVSALDRVYGKKPLLRRLSQRMGLQAKLVLVFVFLIGLTLGSFLLLTLRETRDRMIGDLYGQARLVSLTLSALGSDALAYGSTDQLAPVADELVRSSANVIEVVFYNLEGTPVASKSRGLSEIKAFDPRITTKLGQVQVLTDSGNEHLCLVSPIFANEGHRIVGYIRVGISLEQFAYQTRAIAYAAVKVGGALLILSIAMVWLLVKRIFLPIRILVQAARRIAGGDLDTRVETDRPDVIGDLSRAFNEISRTVKQQQQALRTANHQLGEANRDLESKVDQRTVQFETANKRLTVEIAEKEDFLRAVSHDLNAPLRNISGMVTMLLMKKKNALDEDTIHRLDRIKKNVEIETDLINELLELSRIKTRRQAMEKVNIEEMIWDLRGMFENDLKTRQINLIVDTALPNLHAERARVRQIFQNLIDNAIKYMNDDSAREIHIGCQIRLSEAEFYVRDTGLGMDADDASKVFFVFRRGKNNAAQNVSGKGVGLASVKSIVETYSGKIWVESEPAKGSTFRFTINGQYVPATGGGQRKTPAQEQHAAAA